MATPLLQNDDPTVATYLKAYRSCYRKMILILPIDHFIIDLVEKNKLPGDLKSRIQAKETREMRVQCLLDDIEGGIKAGYPERFDQLIRAVKEYAIRESRTDLKRLAEDTLSQLPDTTAGDLQSTAQGDETNEIGIHGDYIPSVDMSDTKGIDQLSVAMNIKENTPDLLSKDAQLQLLRLDVIPTPVVEPDIYSVMLVGLCGAGKSSAGNFFVKRSVFMDGTCPFMDGTCPFLASLAHTSVIAHKLVKVIDTLGFMTNTDNYDTFQTISELIQLASEGVHAIALVYNVRHHFTADDTKFIEILLRKSWPFSLTFVLFAHAKFMGHNDHKQKEKLMKAVQDPQCPDPLKRLMKLVGWRIMMLETKDPMGTGYYDSKCCELIGMIKKIYNYNQIGLTIDDLRLDSNTI